MLMNYWPAFVEQTQSYKVSDSLCNFGFVLMYYQIINWSVLLHSFK